MRDSRKTPDVVLLTRLTYKHGHICRKYYNRLTRIHKSTVVACYRSHNTFSDDSKIVNGETQ